MFGDYIKQLRESRGLNQSEAARKIGISVQKLWDAENNRRYITKIPRKVIDGMARAYGVPAEVIETSTKIRVFTGQTQTEMLAEYMGILDKALKLSTDMVNESREFTPELEAYAVRLFELISGLKRKVAHAYGQHYSNTPKRKKHAATGTQGPTGNSGATGA